MAGLANWVMTYVETYLTGWVGERILADLRIRLFRQLQRLSLGFYERNRAGVIISRLTNDVEAIDQLVTDGVTTLVQNTLMLVGTAIILFVLDWRLALATCAVIPLMSIATAIFRTRSARAYAAVRERLGLLTATLAEDIAGMRIVQSFTREDAAYANFRDVAGRYREANMQTVVLNGLYFPFVDLLSTSRSRSCSAMAGTSTSADAVARDALRLHALRAELLRPRPAALAALQHVPLRRRRRWTRSWTCSTRSPGRRPPRRRASSRDRRATCASTTFASATAAATRCCTASTSTCPAGTTVALVGHTGAGKSTIAKLIARFYEPTHGAHHHRRPRPERRDAVIAATPARRRSARGFPLRRHGRYNIAFGKPDATPDEILHAAQTVGAHEFILRLEDGYETQLGERGSRLSLGQRQLSRSHVRSSPTRAS